MKELLLLVMLVALGLLWYDDRTQRAALEQTQQQVQAQQEEITTGRYALSHQAPEWFQERLHEPPALNTGSLDDAPHKTGR